MLTKRSAGAVRPTLERVDDTPCLAAVFGRGATSAMDDSRSRPVFEETGSEVSVERATGHSLAEAGFTGLSGQV